MPKDRQPSEKLVTSACLDRVAHVARLLQVQVQVQVPRCCWTVVVVVFHLMSADIDTSRLSITLGAYACITFVIVWVLGSCNW